MTKELFQQYSILVDYLGKVLGPDYEIVLHDLTQSNKQVVAIANGHISGRTVGSPLTNTALCLIKSKAYMNEDFLINYNGETENGHMIRSSTMFIKNSHGILEGLLCINFDDSRFSNLSRRLFELIHGSAFVHTIQDEPAVQLSVPFSLSSAERFPTDIAKLMQQIFEDVMKDIKTPPERLTQEEKITIISQLDKHGLFRLKGAIPFTAKHLACSSSSIYRYLKTLEH